MTSSQPCGTWPSPISASLVATQGVRLSAVAVDGDDIYWIEGRPAEGGRGVIVRRRPDGRIEDVIGEGFNARTRVHEYGGGAYAVAAGQVYFANFVDQRLYAAGITGPDVGGPPEGGPCVLRPPEGGVYMPRPITPEGAWRYADLIVDPARRRLIAVREDHTRQGTEPQNTLVSIDLDGEPGPGRVLASGYDFYSTPRLSPDGTQLAWLAWRHPQMPWDGTELWVAGVDASGALVGERLIAGGNSESIYQPGWSPDGTLYFVSDREGWWRIYGAMVRACEGAKVGDGAEVRAVLTAPPADAEFGQPQWIFGTSTWAFAGPSRLVVSYTRRGRWRLALIDRESGTLSDLPTSLQPREWLVATATHAIVIAGNETTPDAVVRIDLANGAVEALSPAAPPDVVDQRYLSVPEPIEFPTSRGRTAHAFYYPPRHANCAAPAGERPPLIVVSHGGPTTAAVAAYELKVQFWTSRGFAVVDVNYGGSSGFGREYRQRLNGEWGVVDVEDCVNAARALVASGAADPARLIIRGGSAGGYTTLAALVFHPDVFTAAASYYGISDIEVLARDTHKFESRYLDGLIGPYPEAAAVYKARSPIHHVDKLSCPLILFQGLEDKVVPPNQSQMMADAVRAKGLRVAYLTFEGEQHGFRKAETIIHCLEAELAFYQAVFGMVAE